MSLKGRFLDRFLVRGHEIIWLDDHKGLAVDPSRFGEAVCPIK